MLIYPYRFTPEGDGAVIIRFPDFPESRTRAAKKLPSEGLVRKALEAAIMAAFSAGRRIPMPSVPRRGQRMLALPVSMGVKVLLLNEFTASGMRQAELARRLGMTPQEITRLINLRHATKIDGLLRAFFVFGKRLECRVLDVGQPAD